METKTNLIFTVTKVLFWIVFIGYCIKAGTLAFTFLYSHFNPAIAHDLYLGLNLSELMQSSLLHYSAALSLVIMLTALKAYTAFLVVRLLRKIDLEQPFSLLVSRLIFKISKVTLEVGILALVGRSYFLWLLHNQVAPAQLAQFIPEGTVYLFLACIIFVIAQIFKRGVTLQTENELTV